MDIQNKRAQGMAIASLVMGILSLLTCCCIYSALPFGALGIIFALLSRGGEQKLDTKGIVGLVLGIAGLLCAILVFVLMFVYTINFYGGLDGFMQYYNELMEQYMQYYPQ